MTADKIAVRTQEGLQGKRKGGCNDPSNDGAVCPDPKPAEIKTQGTLYARYGYAKGRI